jgi:hypothetical protein
LDVVVLDESPSGLERLGEMIDDEGERSARTAMEMLTDGSRRDVAMRSAHMAIPAANQFWDSAGVGADALPWWSRKRW